MFQIRPIVKIDNCQVKKLIQMVMTEYDCSGEGFSIHDEELHNMFVAYNKPGHIFLVIESNQKILGCGGIGSLAGDDQICELKKMYFYPELRGKGLGKELMTRLILFAKKHYQGIYIETTKQMIEANSIYKRFNFKKIDQPLGNTGHFGCDQFYLLKFN